MNCSHYVQPALFAIESYGSHVANKATMLSLNEFLNSSKAKIANAAQSVYDEWEQDADGDSIVYGSGGICDEIANKISIVLSNSFQEISDDVFEITDGGQDGDEHAWIIVHNGKKAFGVDISPYIYESGGGYTWKKKHGVKILPEHVEIWEIDIKNVIETD